MKTSNRYSAEVRERAVRMVSEHLHEYPSQWAAIESISAKIGCTSETVRHWVWRAERDAGTRPGLSTSERDRLKELERENRELKRANEILRKASAFFAQAELDRRVKWASLGIPDLNQGRLCRRLEHRLKLTRRPIADARV